MATVVKFKQDRSARLAAGIAFWAFFAVFPLLLVLAVLAFLEKIPRVGDHLGLLEFATWIYIAWYLYRGMRNVYQQRRALTVAKYFAVGFFYVCAASTVLILTAVFSAMTA